MNKESIGRNTLEELIEINKAVRQGKTIQSFGASRKWVDIGIPASNNPLDWNLTYFRFRVKPELVEGWVNVYPDVTSGIHPSKEDADRASSGNRVRVIHIREVA